jgi:lysozyme
VYKLGEAGTKLILDFEKFKGTSYQDQKGVWTIGYGTTRLNGSPVTEGMAISTSVAIALFRGDCKDRLIFLGNCMVDSLNQNQVDALVSLSYNIGKEGFFESTLRKVINNHQAVFEDYFTRWNKVRINGKLIVSDGLIRRRKAEYQLFMSTNGL